MLFIIVALGSGSSSQYMTKGSSSKRSTPKSLVVPGAQFPKTAQTCTSCMGAGCASCNYTGTVMR